MGLRVRSIGLVTLVGFLAVTAWSAGLFPAPCCSASWERCPITFCKGSTADSSPKVDLAGGAREAGIPSRLVSRSPELFLSLAQIPAFLPHEFVRPMRN